MRQETPSRLSTSRREPTLNDVVDADVERWIVQFPIDLWWRRKHAVAYGSPRHRAMSFFDQLHEYREEVLLRRLAVEQRERDIQGDDYDSRVVKLSQEQIDEDYDSINLDDF
jgi:hypothetical protein